MVEDSLSEAGFELVIVPSAETAELFSSNTERFRSLVSDVNFKATSMAVN
jgi:hypothetical protein